MDDKTAQSIREAIDKRAEGASPEWALFVGRDLFLAFQEREWIAMNHVGETRYNGTRKVFMRLSLGATDFDFARVAG